MSVSYKAGRFGRGRGWAIATIAAILCAAQARAEQVEIYRDYFGVPHIYAETAEGACFGMGYVQAEDRLEQLLRSYRTAAGTMAEAFGPEWFESDVRQRMWRHEAKAREHHHKKSEKIRAITAAYQEGIKLFMTRHPEAVPAWAPQIEPWQVAALGRYFMWSWPEGEARDELKKVGIQYDLPKYEYRGSNQWLIAPSRTAEGKVIALVDPHLSWYGHMRFYEARLYGGEIASSGMAVVGLPLMTLGHSRYASIAMTTGGPDTTDVYKELVNPNNPLQYRYEGEWRDMEVLRETIRIKDGPFTRSQEVEFHYTHHGPVVAREGDVAYAVAVPYFEEIYQIDQVYAMHTARNLTEMKQAIGMLQYMAQNIMVGTVQGDIYYVRNGRVPVRPAGWDFSRPVPGYVADTEWQGLHPLEDLVQIENPPGGYMQNNNVSPSAMMEASPLVPENYPAYIYNDSMRPAHQRAAMTRAQLAANSRVTVRQALEIAMSTQVYGAEAWQARLNEAWETMEVDINEDVDVTILRSIINDWNRRSTADSVGATAYKYWKAALPAHAKKGDRGGGPPEESLTDREVISALREAAHTLAEEHGSLQVPYGRIHRVGRREGEESWPVGGGNPGHGMATPRNIGFDRLEDGTFLGRSGQCATQIVLLTDPPQSWTYVPLGQSDDPASAHFDDQAELLFGSRRMKPSYFLQRDEVEKQAESKIELEF